MSDELVGDLERVGRWFWLTLLFGFSLAHRGVPVLLPVVGATLLWSLKRLGRRPDDQARPDVRVPLALTALAIIAALAPLLLDAPERLPQWCAAAATIAGMVGVDAYLTALGAVNRRSWQVAVDVGQVRRVWWVCASVLAVVIIASLVATDPAATGTSSIDVGTRVDWTGPPWVTWALVGALPVFAFGLYRVGDAHWRLLSGLRRVGFRTTARFPPP